MERDKKGPATESLGYESVVRHRAPPTAPTIKRRQPNLRAWLAAGLGRSAPIEHTIEWPRAHFLPWLAGGIVAAAGTGMILRKWDVLNIH